MTSEDPFGLSEDQGRTRIRPPAGAMPPVIPTGALARRARSHPNTLINAFATLLEFAPELENALPPGNPEALRTRLMEELVSARDAAVAAGASLAQADAAAWAVASLLDDLALNTPWGGSSAWPRQPLVVMLRGDVDAGAQFFARLEELERYPGRDRELLELQYFCLALGFRGKYRVPGRAGDRSISAVRAAAARFLRDADAEGAPLSPRWEGVAAADEPSRFAVPIWVLAVVAVALATAIYVLLSARLGARAEELATLVRALPPPERAEIYRPEKRAPAPDAPPVEPVVLELLPEFRAAAPSALLPALKGNENASRVTLLLQSSTPELFQSARPELTKSFEPLVASVAAVIKENAELIRSVTIIGHTDNVPLQTSNPLSNNQRLSEARAATIAALLRASGLPPERLKSEGRAATQPLARNDTREGRAANRRIELLIEKGL
ncbi:type VI secretion system DotU/OmpA/MotB outer membrane protein (plasmid) [Rhizobium etli 8C-3]|uniref:Type VI secretion system protein ImpK n=2 Tax=Rhizobium TaxID=379 RepID=A0A4V2VF77_9HYPH|nr:MULTISPECIES: type IVB secretion system protein IcmH/DotU [Rhizobium]APO78559.1 type VI secretion system DotU/OmpA/MotB outer membrane protein [Rhizobium etli 8C-3]TCU24649.1 type VI secretion system protein ImpK [Rhizobium azibense]TCU39395.1 type VI secretion system protein ImpK [Rhizobium azibense]